MKRFVQGLLGLVLVLLLFACGSQPAEEMTAARAAVEAASSEGAPKFLPQEFKQLSGELSAALAEVEVQDGKLFKSYGAVKEQLVKIKGDAETLRNKVIAIKRPLMEKAKADLTAATDAVGLAKAALDNLPKAKDAAGDLLLLRNDLEKLEARLLEIQPLITKMEYTEASTQALAVKGDAETVSAQIEAAIAKKKRIGRH